MGYLCSNTQLRELALSIAEIISENGIHRQASKQKSWVVVKFKGTFVAFMTNGSADIH